MLDHVFSLQLRCTSRSSQQLRNIPTVSVAIIKYGKLAYPASLEVYGRRIKKRLYYIKAKGK